MRWASAAYSQWTLAGTKAPGPTWLASLVHLFVGRSSIWVSKWERPRQGMVFPLQRSGPPRRASSLLPHPPAGLTLGPALPVSGDPHASPFPPDPDQICLLCQACLDKSPDRMTFFSSSSAPTVYTFLLKAELGLNRIVHSSILSAVTQGAYPVLPVRFCALGTQ